MSQILTKCTETGPSHGLRETIQPLRLFLPQRRLTLPVVQALDSRLAQSLLLSRKRTSEGKAAPRGHAPANLPQLASTVYAEYR